jgi:hypothetical protein
LGVHPWDRHSGTVAGESYPTNGAFAIADPRVAGHARSVMLGVRAWGMTAPCLKADMSVGGGPYAVADVRMTGGPRFNNTYRVVRYGDASAAVAGPGGPGGLAVADPRPNWGNGRHEAIMRVTAHDAPVGTIPANAHSVTGGQPCVADVRREHYQTGGHYGVLPWCGTALTVSASACHDNGFNSVADPRAVDLEEAARPALPEPTQKLVCRIIAEDGTWHRPFTTLELGSLQSLFDPEEAFCQDPETGGWQAREGFELVGVDGRAVSDASVREWIGNAVPSEAARAMATTIGETLLLAGAGEGFTLSTRQIWVKPLALALAVDSRQPAFELDRGR